MHDLRDKEGITDIRKIPRKCKRKSKDGNSILERKNIIFIITRGKEIVAFEASIHSLSLHIKLLPQINKDLLFASQ